MIFFFSSSATPPPTVIRGCGEEETKCEDSPKFLRRDSHVDWSLIQSDGSPINKIRKVEEAEEVEIQETLATTWTGIMMN